MEPDARGKDWRVRWQTDRESVSVAAGVPPLLVLEALAHATRAVERGVEVKAATVIDSLEARERTG